MERISSIIKLPERLPEESEATQADSEMWESRLTAAKETVRKGLSRRANAMMKIPVRYHGKSLPKSTKTQRALQALKSGRSLFLTGIPGSGKTHIACALLNEWFAGSFTLSGEGVPYPANRPPLFLPAVELLLEIKASWHSEENLMAESENDLLARYTRAPLLVLDDLGAEKVSDWSRQVVYLLIDRRYRDMMPTIITSNLSLEDLARQLDERIASRICEMGIVVVLDGKDWRVT